MLAFALMALLAPLAWSDAAAKQSFLVRSGALAAGDDLEGDAAPGLRTVAEAERICGARTDCAGFTFFGNSSDAAGAVKARWRLPSPLPPFPHHTLKHPRTRAAHVHSFQRVCGLSGGGHVMAMGAIFGGGVLLGDQDVGPQAPPPSGRCAWQYDAEAARRRQSSRLGTPWPQPPT